MKESLTVKDLREVKEVLDKLSVKCWLDYGTLLGAVRDGKIIEGDHDIDFGTFDDSWEKIAIAIPEFEKRGFKVHFVKFEPCENFSQKDAVFHRFGLPIGIHFYQVKSRNAIRFANLANRFIDSQTNRISQDVKGLHYLLSSQKVYTWWNPKLNPIVEVLKRCLSPLPSELKKSLSKLVQLAWMEIPKIMMAVIVPKHYFEKLGNIKFYGIEFEIPSNVEDYLKNRYCVNWKAKRKNWKPWESKHNFLITISRKNRRLISNMMQGL